MFEPVPAKCTLCTADLRTAVTGAGSVSSVTRKSYKLTSDMASIFDFFTMEVSTVKVIIIFKASLLDGILPKS